MIEAGGYLTSASSFRIKIRHKVEKRNKQLAEAEGSEKRPTNNPTELPEILESPKIPETLIPEQPLDPPRNEAVNEASSSSRNTNQISETVLWESVYKELDDMLIPDKPNPLLRPNIDRSIWQTPRTEDLNPRERLLKAIREKACKRYKKNTTTLDVIEENQENRQKPKNTEKNIRPQDKLIFEIQSDHSRKIDLQKIHDSNDEKEKPHEETLRQEESMDDSWLTIEDSE